MCPSLSELCLSLRWEFGRGGELGVSGTFAENILIMGALEW